MVSPGTSALLKSLLIPPLSALLLYLLLTYALLPWYRNHRTRRSYTAVPTSSSPNIPFSNNAPRLPPAILATLTTVLHSISKAIVKASGGRLEGTLEGGFGGMTRGRGYSESSMEGFGVGDEELEEGVGVVMPGLGGEMGAEGRRLSRELEGGFMGDSSDDDDHNNQAGGRR